MALLKQSFPLEKTSIPRGFVWRPSYGGCHGVPPKVAAPVRYENLGISRL